jgi:hypothetical protein
VINDELGTIWKERLCPVLKYQPSFCLEDGGNTNTSVILVNNPVESQNTS